MEDFWLPRLSTTISARRLIPGWSHVEEGLATFLEAPLALGAGFGGADPQLSDVLLVSAPGAVGKTTLARQIAVRTGAMLVNLAEGAAVGAGTMTGGLARTGLYDQFLEGRASVIVDGLDEARIRVTQAGFAAFIEDIVDLVASREQESYGPIVLFGRTGAVEESWLLFSEHNMEPPVLEIGYFDHNNAKDFATIQANHLRGNQHEPDRRAIELILDQLQSQTLSDGNAFAGYSPVLIAVAKRVADPKDPEFEANTAQLISRLEHGTEHITLAGIAQSILEREQTKIRSLNLSDPELLDTLYTPEEQFARLVHRVYGHGSNVVLPPMTPSDRQAYESALETWVNEHPFLDGVGRQPSSAVFGGLIAAKALRNEAVSDEVLSQELNQSTLVNPFLAEFYISSLREEHNAILGEEQNANLREEQNADVPEISATHIGLIYASLSARLSSGQNASLRIDADVADINNADAEVEISIEGDGDVVLEFTTDSTEHFRFGRKMQDVTIICPMAALTVGDGSELTLVSPLSLQVGTLILSGNQVTVEQPAHRALEEIEDVVDITVEQQAISQVVTLPRLAGAVALEVRWPGSESWPWSAYSVPERDEGDPRIYDGINALLRILRLFRSKGKGNLAKYCGAIDHHRRTYGLGQAMRDQLIREEVLSRKDPFYFLDPDQLMESAGLMYNTVRAGIANETTREFVRRGLENADR